ncbi:MAG: response regulator transcription factor [Deltaproteobacteria bacterium]|nr:response regulator transcription factor [Deltaproteobacteria bacterium]
MKIKNEENAKRTSPPTVFIVDDEPLVLKAVSRSIAGLACITQTFSSAVACLEAVKQYGCDLIISDINMPEMSGLQLLEAVKSSRPETAIVLVTGYGDIPMAVEAVQLGAADFLEKPLNEETFLPKIQSLLNQLSSRKKLPLTESETEILRLIASGKSNKEIAFILKRSIRTVENHRHRMMEKLGAGSQAELTKIAIAHGLTTIELDKSGR